MVNITNAHNLTPDIIEICKKAGPNGGKCPFLYELYPQLPKMGQFVCEILADVCALNNQYSIVEPKNATQFLYEFFEQKGKNKSDVPTSCPCEWYMDI